MITTPEELVASLSKSAPGDRYVYAAARGGYYITYRGGQVHPDAIKQAMQAGQIKPRYEARPNVEAWNLSRQQQEGK